MRKTINTNDKSVDLGLLILDLSQTVMYEFYWIYKTDSSIEYATADGIYKDMAEGIETRFNNSYFELDRPLL